MNEKTYKELKEQLDDIESTSTELLKEFRMVRSGTALALAGRAKFSGDKVVQNANKGQSILQKSNPNTSLEDKVEHMNQAMVSLFDCLIHTRLQIGNLVGISLTSTLISERSTKELTKILKQRR